MFGVWCLINTFVFTTSAESIDGNGASEWAISEVEEAIRLGFVNDNFKNDFQMNITREEFAVTAVMFVAYQNNMDVIDVRNLYVNGGRLEKADSDDFDSWHFDDTSDSEYANYITLAASMGIVKGKGNKCFDPASPITRQEAAAMLNRVFALYAKDSEIDETDVSEIRDFETIDDWAKNSVKNVYALNVMRGTGEAFEPRAFYTREQCYAAFVRLCKCDKMKSRYHGENLCFLSYEELLGDIKAQANYDEVYSNENEFCSVNVGFAQAFFSGAGGFWVVYKNGGRKNLIQQFGSINVYDFDENAFEFDESGKTLYCALIHTANGTKTEYRIDLVKALVDKIN